MKQNYALRLLWRSRMGKDPKIKTLNPFWILGADQIIVITASLATSGSKESILTRRSKNALENATLNSIPDISFIRGMMCGSKTTL